MKVNNQPKSPPCPICGADPMHPNYIPGSGSNVRGNVRGNIVAALRDKGIIVILNETHVFFRCNGDEVEGHHLICCEAVKEDEWKKLFDFFCYDVNCAENGVLFPGDMQVACHYAVPLHKGNHEATIGDFQTKKNYVLSVKDKVEKLKEQSKAFCDKDDKREQFLKKAKEVSEAILKKLVNFKWTITADGKDYDDGLAKIGCYGNTSITRKRDALLKITPIANSAKAPKAALHEMLAEKKNALCSRNHKDDGCIKPLNWKECTILTVSPKTILKPKKYE